ncbi:MAG: hypothetical protein IJV30_09695 [Oscillospiraceae bacterium]|nr:hypothetical protein [Oscillospiraceae bacterium]
MITEPAYNASLLSIISELGECTIDEVKDKYFLPEQAGVIDGSRFFFEKELQTLIDLGYVERDGETLRYTGKPRRNR